MTLTMLGLAIKRGLFPGGMAYVLETNDAWLKTDPIVAKQAVFVAADHQGNITPDVPMKTDALNPRLRRACIDAGLPQRNTMYCFRRTRIIETKHAHGTDAARAIAAHTDDSSAHERYDTINIGDIDIQSYILGTKSMSREDARKMFSQAFQTAYTQHSSDYHTSLQEELQDRLRDREREDTEYIETAQSVKDTIDNTREFLLSNTEDASKVPRGYTGAVTGTYKILLKNADNDQAKGVLEKLNAVFYKRKTTLKKIRQTLRNAILRELADEMRSLLKDGKDAATRGLTSGKGGVPKSIRKEAKDAQDELERFHNARLNAVKELLQQKEQPDPAEPDAANEEGVDIDSLEEQEERLNPRGEPLHWHDMPEEQTVQIDLGLEEGEKEPNGEERIAFLEAFVARKSRPNSGLTCWRCNLDPSASKAAKEKKFTRAQLHKHLKGKAHTRREQLISAFNTLKSALGGSKVACPFCPERTYQTAAKWLQHVEGHHHEELWLDHEDGSGDDDEEFDFEGL